MIDSPAYGTNGYDPNWRGFIGTALILGVEEFGHRLSSDLTALIVDSLKNNTIGDTYRNDIVNSSNFHPGYSNPVRLSYASPTRFLVFELTGFSGLCDVLSHVGPAIV